VKATLPADRAGADLAVLAGGPGSDHRTLDRLLRAGIPHLVARVRETTGVVGPLVLPGRSSCQRCHDLHRTDRDPAWPRIAAQLSAASRLRTAACDSVLATAVAAHAALQVLAYLDGDPAPPAVDGTLEISQADGRVRRRSWVAHPACGCSWGHLAEPGSG
jgi:bacteriocin biosynthesis cyclodehydratase domain-containing protein